MSANENNDNVAMPTADGGFIGISNGHLEAGMIQRAMHMMQETGKPAVLVKFTAPGTDLVLTGLIDRDGNFRVIHRTYEHDSAKN